MTNQQFEPFYDVNRTYDDNYRRGPFGQFAQALTGGPRRKPTLRRRARLPACLASR